jgi:hypothetical protein
LNVDCRLSIEKSCLIAATGGMRGPLNRQSKIGKIGLSLPIPDRRMQRNVAKFPTFKRQSSIENRQLLTRGEIQT